MPNTSLWNDLKALPGPYWVLFSGTLVNRFGHFVMPFLALYLQREGYAAWVTAVALGAYGAGGLIAGLLGGYCADRWARFSECRSSPFGRMESGWRVSRWDWPLVGWFVLDPALANRVEGDSSPNSKARHRCHKEARHSRPRDR